MSFWVYILASERNGTLYTGHTDDLPKRVWEHREELKPGFTAKYHVHRLVWAESCPTRDEDEGPRGPHQAVETRLEAAPDRERQSGLE